MPKTKKQTVKKVVKRPSKAKHARVKASIKANRPLHRRLALHPVNVFFLLLVGVIIVLSCFSASADSYTVTATAPDPPPPTVPAVITYPTPGQTVTNRVLNVSGTCPNTPNNTYVVLFTNDVWTAVGTCAAGGAFQISTELYPGPNLLQVRDYDFYGQPGPRLPPFSMTYNAPQVVTQPTAEAFVAPVSSTQGVQVLQVDQNVPYISQSVVQNVTFDPTFSGIAPPFSHISIMIHSNPIYCTTTADSQGYWSCRVNTTLPAGVHHVYVTATTTSGQILNFQSFEVDATPQSANTTLPAQSLSLTTNFKYTTYPINSTVNFTLDAQGGSAPYAFSINWGDGTTSEVTRLTAGPFTVSHTYTKTSQLLTNEPVKIEGIDSLGNSTSIQLVAPINNPAYHNIITYVSQSTGLLGTLSNIKSKAWLIAPAYGAAALMVISFWLGERQELLVRVAHSPRRQHLTSKRK